MHLLHRLGKHVPLTSVDTPSQYETPVKDYIICQILSSGLTLPHYEGIAITKQYFLGNCLMLGTFLR